MKEFFFLCTREEWSDLLREVVEVNHLRFIPDEWYSTPSPGIYHEMTEKMISRIIARKRRIFLIGDFTVRGVHIDGQPSMKKSEEYIYTVSQTKNGPLIDFSLPADYDENGMRRLVSGHLGYQTEWYSPDLSQRWPASEELKQAFCAVRDTIKKRLVMVNPRDKTWMSHAALDLVKAGQATLPVGGKWVGKEHIVREN